MKKLAFVSLAAMLGLGMGSAFAQSCSGPLPKYADHTVSIYNNAGTGVSGGFTVQAAEGFETDANGHVVKCNAPMDVSVTNLAGPGAQASLATNDDSVSVKGVNLPLPKGMGSIYLQGFSSLDGCKNVKDKFPAGHYECYMVDDFFVGVGANK